MNRDYRYLDNMKRAEEFVAAARVCLEQDFSNSAASRAYYAVLHAGVAALVTITRNHSVDSLMNGKTHGKVAALFDLEFVNRTKLFHYHKGVIHDLRERRHDADYRDGVNHSKAKKCVEKAEGLVSAVRGEIEK